MAAMGCRIAGYPCLQCTDRGKVDCTSPQTALQKVIDALNEGIDPEYLGLEVVEEEESDIDFYKKHFEVRR